jgi:multiple sugar transport system permease protein
VRLPLLLSVLSLHCAFIQVYADSTSLHDAWNELLFASLLTTESTRTLAVGLQDYAMQSNVYWKQLMAASIVGSISIVIAFLALQRYIVQGLTSGAVK